MFKNKKADLSLSINAIVILILAITMLGLGLTFMRGLFKQATGKVEAAVSAQELANPPTIDNPVTLYPSTLTLRRNEQGKILLAFMHAEGSDRTCHLVIIDVDGTSVNFANNYGYYMVYNGVDVAGIPADKIYTWTITIDPDEDTGGQVQTKLEDNCDTDPASITCPHIYTAKIECTSGGTYKKDILIKITS